MFEPTWDYIAVIFAGFLGGALNAIAGGGSFITLPVLIMAGLSPISANVTGTVALLPGYIASAWRLRKSMSAINHLLWMYSLIAAAGGVLGALLLCVSSNQLFEKLIPWLMLLSTLTFVFGPKIRSKTNSEGRFGNTQHNLILFCLCVYGGYFNGGVGIMLLAGLSIMSTANLHGLNGVKSLMSAILTLIASLVYLSTGMVELRFLIAMSLAAVVGGHCGAAITYRISQHTLRSSIIGVGLVVTILFFIKTIFE